MIAWLLTFLVHSTLWLGLVWLWTRLRPNTHARLRETIWYTAIVASFVTPTVTMLVSSDSAVWRVTLPASLSSVGEAGHTEADSTAARRSAHAERERAERHDLLAPATATDTTAPSASESHADWQVIAHCAWLGVGGVLVLFYCWRLEALGRRIGHRVVVEDRRARRTHARLSHRAGLRHTPHLTASDHLGSPIAIGFGRRAEICVPTRAFHELDGDQLSALLAHETAHHGRRDPLRLSALNSLRALFFIQPLLRSAVRAVHLAADEQCDHWASQQVGDRLAMASCLTEVAAWIIPQDRRLPVPGMARRQSQLGLRVNRLMDEDRSLQAPPRLWRGLFSAGLLGLTLWLAPVVAPASEHAHQDEVTIRPLASGGDSATGVYREFQAIESQAVELEAVLQLLTHQLGPLAEAPGGYRKQVESIEEQLDQLRPARSMLRSIFGVEPAGHGTTPHGRPSSTQAPTHRKDDD